MDTEILRLYLNGSNIPYIARRLRMSEEEVIRVLFSNKSTAEKLKKEHDEYLKGKFVKSLHRSSVGRYKLPDHKKRKLRQIRISDEELKEMGNPSSSAIRKRALNYSKIFEVVELLEKNDLISIPDNWFDFDTNEPFWVDALSSQADRLRYLINNQYLIKRQKNE